MIDNRSRANEASFFDDCVVVDNAVRFDHTAQADFGVFTHHCSGVDYAHRFFNLLKYALSDIGISDSHNYAIIAVLDFFESIYSADCFRVVVIQKIYILVLTLSDFFDNLTVATCADNQ